MLAEPSLERDQYTYIMQIIYFNTKHLHSSCILNNANLTIPQLHHQKTNLSYDLEWADLIDLTLIDVTRHIHEQHCLLFQDKFIGPISKIDL